jgi:hypothetical protein
MKAELIKVQDIQDGDIIWFDVSDSDSNYDEIEALTTGYDIIKIIDDASMAYEGCFLVNGGQTVNIDLKAIVYKIGHYSELISQID